MCGAIIPEGRQVYPNCMKGFVLVLEFENIVKYNMVVIDADRKIMILNQKTEAIDKWPGTGGC